MFLENVFKLLFNDIADKSLGIGHTDIQRHFRDAEHFISGRIGKHDVSDLRTIAVGNYNIVFTFQQFDQAFGS